MSDITTSGGVHYVQVGDTVAVYGTLVGLDFGDEDRPDHSIMKVAYNPAVRVGNMGEVAVVSKAAFDELVRKAEGKS